MQAGDGFLHGRVNAITLLILLLFQQFPGNDPAIIRQLQRIHTRRKMRCRKPGLVSARGQHLIHQHSHLFAGYVVYRKMGVCRFFKGKTDGIVLPERIGKTV